MITTDTAELFITIINFLLAYFFIITSANIFRAWVALRMGDDTGARLGFLTFNPFVHVDPVGIICLFVFYFGWGRMVPVFPFNIYGSYRSLRIAAAYFSDTLVHFLQALCGIIILLALFDINIIEVVRFMVLTHAISHLFIANMYPEVSTFAVLIGFITFAVVYLSVILGVLTFIINLCNYLFFILSEHFASAARYTNYITFGLPIFLILFFSGLLRLLAVNMIAHIGFVIARVLGLT